MLRKITGILLLALAFCACKSPVEEQLLGKWRSAKIEESNWDEFFRDSQKIIDTMGRGHTDEENLEIYETANIDSFRREMQTKYDSAFAALKVIETGSTLHFLSDSIIHLSFPGLNESGKWHVNTEGHLIIDETSKDGEIQHLVIHINQLTPTDMTLIFPHGVKNSGSNDSSVVSFHREKN